MYKFFTQHFSKNVANTLIVIWYIFLIVFDIVVIYRNLAGGRFRYLGQ